LNIISEFFCIFGGVFFFFNFTSFCVVSFNNVFLKKIVWFYFLWIFWILHINPILFHSINPMIFFFKLESIFILFL
jgi:hypothetical protein